MINPNQVEVNSSDLLNCKEFLGKNANLKVTNLEEGKPFCVFTFETVKQADDFSHSYNHSFEPLNLLIND